MSILVVLPVVVTDLVIVIQPIQWFQQLEPFERFVQQVELRLIRF